MRQLLYLNVVILVVASTLALVLAVVAFIYLFYVGEHPQLREEFPVLLKSAGWFVALACVSGVATWLLRARRRGFWIGQGVLACLIALIVLYYLPK